MKLQIGIDGKKYEVEVEVLEEDEPPRHPNFGPYQPFQSTVLSTPVAAPHATAPAEPENAGEDKVCRSPVAGVVIKVNVNAGQQIRSHDLLIVLEAMKMETNITAAADGRIKTVRVSQGDAVKVNQVVVEFE